jgi:threonine synthase
VELTCGGCGAAVDGLGAYPFRCPNFAQGDVDHVLVASQPRLRRDYWPTRSAGPSHDDNPFVSFRRLLDCHRRSLAIGITDARYIKIVTELTRSIHSVDGNKLGATPLTRSGYISAFYGFTPDGGVWVKDETPNVAGSHKVRHLMGLMVHLLASEQAGITDRRSRPDLAIASCGNAALAAAVVAAAAGWRLKVYVPSQADAEVMTRLATLGAIVIPCERRAGESGDPTYQRLLEGILDGDIAFTCQGDLNALCLDGGRTLGYEVVSDAVAAAAIPDHVVIQVGGGALATSCIRAFTCAAQAGVIASMPRVHTLQPLGAHPLERAFTKLKGQPGPAPDATRVADLLGDAARHRSLYMWPWDEPRSVASGIVDDETYDWLAVVGGMLETGGSALVASEQELVDAHTLVANAGFAASPTGAAGVAGVAKLLGSGVISPNDKVLVLATGVR